MGLGAILNNVLKATIDRPRPDASQIQVLIEYPNQSFPSGHVTLFVELFGFLLYLYWRGHLGMPQSRIVSSALPLAIAAVGPSRVYLGAHWPSDVLGGYLGGALWLVLMILVYESRQPPVRRL